MLDCFIFRLIIFVLLKRSDKHAKLQYYILIQLEKRIKEWHNRGMSYDSKYRRRALEYWEDGHNQRETAKVFNISTSTLQEWKSQLKNTGKLESKKRVETWRKIEPKKLREYVTEHPDAYLREIAEEFGCSDTAVMKALRRLKISRKKNHAVQGSE